MSHLGACGGPRRAACARGGGGISPNGEVYLSGLRHRMEPSGIAGAIYAAPVGGVGVGGARGTDWPREGGLWERGSRLDLHAALIF